MKPRSISLTLAVVLILGCVIRFSAAPSHSELLGVLANERHNASAPPQPLGYYEYLAAAATFRFNDQTAIEAPSRVP